MSAKFDKAVAMVGSLSTNIKPTQEDQLKFYSLYKQATVGDVNTTRPGMMDFAGKYKWDAWKKVEGKSQEDAKSEYVEALQQLLTKDGSEEAKQALAELDSA